MNSFSKLAISIWQLFSSLAIETPVTLAVIVAILVCYYYFQKKLIDFIKSPKVFKKFPHFIQEKLAKPKTYYSKYVQTSILRFLEFGLLLVAATYLAGIFGLAMPSTIDSSERNLFKWVNYNSPNGGFSLDFPSDPKTFEQSFEGLDGKPIIMHHLTASRAGYEFDVAYMDYPSYGIGFELDFNMLQKAKDASLRQIQATETKEYRIQNGSVQGIDAYAFMPNGSSLRTQYYFVKNRLYTLSSVQPLLRIGYTDHYRFFNSFKFY